uniref:LAGLIDADG homing endonuclease n=1 Tax=Rhizoctonia solani TaxID=456999 RepID=A0A8E8GS30_9AGAM|nr:LAGLIDADG homing endonuclease [Rhizoctonia solani]
MYIQSIGSGLTSFGDLFNDFLASCTDGEIYLLFSSLVPTLPADKPKRLTNLEKSQFILSDELKEILVGLILGDLNLDKQPTNVRLRFKQGIVNKDYLMHLYEIFSGYCPSGPKFTNAAPDKRTGIVYTGLYFNTYSLPCFNALYNLFYIGGVKIVPSNIFELLTPLGLAYFICDDGSFAKSNNIFKFCTENFTESDIDLLIQVLENKFNLKCRKEKRGKGFRIAIKRSSLGTLRELVCPHLHSSMLYKLGL